MSDPDSEVTLAGLLLQGASLLLGGALLFFLALQCLSWTTSREAALYIWMFCVFMAAMMGYGCLKLMTAAAVGFWIAVLSVPELFRRRR